MREHDWQLRPLALEDCDELGRAHMAVWRETYAGLMPADYLSGLSDARCAERWRATASRPPGAPERTLVVLDSSGAIRGFGSAGSSDDAPTDWELYAVNLVAPARGTGVADRLLDDLVGGRATTLWVVEGNLRARAFYRRRGFVDEGGRGAHPATGASELRMVRRHS